MRRATALSMVAIVMLSACHGSDPVTPSADGSYALSSLDEVCDGSLSGRDVLEGLSPEYWATLTYLDRPGTTSLRLRLRLHYSGGEITCLPHADAPAGTRAPSRAAFVTIAARIELLTADAALNEALPITLSGANGTAVTWESPGLQPGDLVGTWDPALPGYDDVSFSLAGGFDGADTWGTLVKGGHRPGHIGESAIAASWRN